MPGMAPRASRVIALVEEVGTLLLSGKYTLNLFVQYGGHFSFEWLVYFDCFVQNGGYFSFE